MIWVLGISGGVCVLLTLFALVIVWGLLHLRGSKRQAFAEINRIELDDIEPLVHECVQVFDRKLGVRLDLDDCNDAAQKLDDAFRDGYKLKGAFAQDDFYWYFAKPIGACLGELLRRHARHQWHKRPGAAPYMDVQLQEGNAEAHPFEKVIKHAEVGEPGDLVAYVAFARTVDDVAEKMAED